MLGAMAGYDPKDLDLGRCAGCRISARRSKSASRASKVGVPKEYRLDGLSPEIAKLWEQGVAWLKDAGRGDQVEITLPHTKYALPVYYIIAPAEASSNLARYDGVRFGLRVPGESLDDMYEADPRRGLRQGSAAPRDDRHLCALRRLLRRLLPAGPAHARADPARTSPTRSKTSTSC